MIDYAEMSKELERYAGVQAVLEHIVKYDCDKFPADFQRHLKQAALDAADLRPSFIKYISHFYADQEWKQIMADVNKKMAEKQQGEDKTENTQP